MLLLLAGLAAGAEASRDDVKPPADPLAVVSNLFNANCATCHGEQLQGAAQGVPLVGGELKRGDSISALIGSIAQGSPDKGMPVWSKTLDAAQIRALAIYVSEKRAGFTQDDQMFRVADPLVIPAGAVKSEQAAFRVETVVDNLDPLPYSMAFLPDGRMLVTEKHVGLSLLSRDGRKTLISGTPKIQRRQAEDVRVLRSLDLSNGWMLGVALHPRYAENGWIYLSYGDLCEKCDKVNANSSVTPSMTRLVRGRIRNGAWVDERPVWTADHASYTQETDLVAGGRIAFDTSGHVFLTVGMKNNNKGVQDLGKPWGKIHRVWDDGRMPRDNPFVHTPGALKSIWSYGHRNPQGLVYDAMTHDLWSSEHGPRGGDEINLILSGHNYGWPLTSLGANYDGSEVDGWKELGIERGHEVIDQPVVDLTPSPAVSAFILYRGNLFPQWRGNIIVGTLKSRELYRVVLSGHSFVRKETLLHDIGRVRDVTSGPDGAIYLLIEHQSGGKILRITPDAAS